MYTPAEYQNEKALRGRASLCSFEWPIGPILAGFQLPLWLPLPFSHPGLLAIPHIPVHI